MYYTLPISVNNKVFHPYQKVKLIKFTLFYKQQVVLRQIDQTEI